MCLFFSHHITFSGLYGKVKQELFSEESCNVDVNSFAACTCYHRETMYNYGDIVYDTHDGDGMCITAVCGENGEIVRTIQVCSITTPIPFTFTTTGKNDVIHAQRGPPNQSSCSTSVLLFYCRKTQNNQCNNFKGTYTNYSDRRVHNNYS